MTIAEEKLDCLKRAKENGYKVVTYTYSTIKEHEEWRKDAPGFDDLISWDEVDENDLYTCCMYNVKNGRVMEVETGKGPMEARKNAMLAWAISRFNDRTIDHYIHKSALDALQVLTIGQAAATGMPIVSDAKYNMTGEFLKNWLKENNISQNKAAELCFVNLRTFQRWIAEKPVMPQGMWELLKIKVKENTKKT